MNNQNTTTKEVIDNFPLELSFSDKNADAVRDVIKKAQESFVYKVKEQKTGNFIDFTIISPRTTLANAYYHLGILLCEAIKTKQILIP